MKKNISINISGILFHIEEDGYYQLKNYLESINKHFSHYEDNQEIIRDIENRIAEIFLSNLKNNKQVITAENVKNLIEKMGTIADFKAAEEREEQSTHQEHEENEFYKYITPPHQEAGKGYKKLCRLENSKILGGVCAGIAHYLAIDPLWTRLIALLLLFSGWFSFSDFDLFTWGWNISFSFGWWAVIAYILLWIILPVSYEVPEEKNIKKLYRNPDDRVIGGVSSGLAAYFNIDVIWTRLGFVGMTFLGGSGFVLYIILWIITPMAKSITERIQMKGGEITLSNIESTIIKHRQPTTEKKESKTRKILIAPFRFLGKVINAIGKALGPFGRFVLEVFRVLFGVIVFLAGLFITLLPFAFLGAYFEFFTNDNFRYMVDAVPGEMLSEILPVWLALALSVAVLIPGIVLTLLGISVLVKRSLIETRFGMAAFALWLISLMVCAFQIPKTVSQFSQRGTYVKETRLKIPENILILETREQDQFNSELGQVNLTLQGTPSDQFTLKQNFTSLGESEEAAINHARNIQYEYVLRDSVLTFDKYFEFPAMAKFRGQRISQTLQIPYNRPFVMDKSLISIIHQTLYSNGYKLKDVHYQNYWVFNENGLLCLTCSSDHKKSKADSLSREMAADRYFMMAP
ncbi:PspC domain-containing protein [Echinicola jeungdonensis]|uniref:PspC domain-containing protein n=1 Tax=Echinicola jeungdonensis TaxID=709343 RepID=A0ABV5J302_9BACT|nr:PspC domain-containing protein [Echinicola jeungdonensis]MDN3668441.1 PspC domain-containing protein [Echinicola jeungdonensis]